MKDIPVELLYLLFFAVVILGQYLAQWFKREQQKQQAEAADTDQPSHTAEPDELPFLPSAAPAQPAPAQSPETPPRRTRSRGSAAPEPAPARARKRFSRDNLFGSRQGIQNAVVVATILGPCRAQTPYDNGQ
ncbi:MAG: hypothetical protein KF804_16140 [Burkholderiales bacterium]|nr:hypothetical protein [Burkholderiales bacterium]